MGSMDSAAANLSMRSHGLVGSSLSKRKHLVVSRIGQYEMEAGEGLCWWCEVSRGGVWSKLRNMHLRLSELQVLPSKPIKHILTEVLEACLGKNSELLMCLVMFQVEVVTDQEEWDFCQK